jgi:CheY-like chemotaxis protein
MFQMLAGVPSCRLPLGLLAPCGHLTRQSLRGPANPPPREGALSSNTILLVGSTSEPATHLRSRLEAGGYAVRHVADGPAAMREVGTSDVALVVTELYVPVGTARCLVRAIRKTPTMQDTRVLAWTTHGRTRDRSWAKRSGAQGYVITRSGEDRLLQVIDRLMRRPRGGTPSPYAGQA